MDKPRMAYDGVYNRYLKRAIDLAVAVPFLILALPLYFVIAIAILLDDGFPVFYCPLRGG